ncbi:MAG TPA: hypothetical protein DHW61_16625 [Lachnoclostridium phytofermentans]|uniref:Flagellar hook-associated protein 2 C-terminal domain-containing protein n=1 Tax=Lachnoclostridium phytofermentans TaxID=66219 RepID=A0A3D2XBV3_9FIRM|nr:hypothetical protein [Lachnoclostridium sp.]HCL04005.1 hypothetical protein [Lachnoclostridium phytofermentans]
MTISTNYYNYSSSLFSSTSQGSSNGSNNILGQYMSIKNGSYKKLLSAYYKKMDAEEAGSSSTTGATSEKSKMLATKKDADSLKEATDKLLNTGKNSIWEQVEKEVKDEKTGQMVKVKDYDYDRIAKAMNEFASSYNSVLESASKQNDLSVLKTTAYMTGITKSNKVALGKMGITVGADNKLTVDESKLKAADISSLKSYFTGSSSFAGRIQGKAFDIGKSAMNAVNSLKTYNKGGNINQSGDLGNWFDMVC